MGEQTSGNRKLSSQQKKNSENLHRNTGDLGIVSKGVYATLKSSDYCVDLPRYILEEDLLRTYLVATIFTSIQSIASSPLQHLIWSQCHVKIINKTSSVEFCRILRITRAKCFREKASNGNREWKQKAENIKRGFEVMEIH